MIDQMLTTSRVLDLMRRLAPYEQGHCRVAMERIVELSDAKEKLTVFLDGLEGDTRLVARAARLVALDVYLDLLRATYVEASEVFGFSTECVADWPTGTWLKLPETEELVDLLEEMVANKRGAIEDMPISQLLDELQASPQFH